MPLIRAGEPPAFKAEAPPAGSDQLVAALHQGMPAERRAAARGLASYPEAVADLAVHLGNEPDASVRDAILTALIALRTPAAAAGLLPYLRSEDAALRNEAIEALQAMPEAVAPYIEKMLSDRNSDVRILMINVLAALPHPLVPRWLEQVVRADQHVNVCAAAIDALAEAGDAATEPALAAVAARFPDEPFIAYAAGIAMRRIAGQ